MINRLVIGLIVGAIVLFPLGMLAEIRPIATVGAVLLGSGAFIDVLDRMRTAKERR